MTIPLSNEAEALLSEPHAFAYLALTLADGTPHVTPVWFAWDGTHIVINTARGRVKDNVLKKHPVVALTVVADDPYHYLLVRGRVVEETEVGGYDMICALNEKYRGKYEFKMPPGQVRVTYKILPEKITVHE